MVKIKSSLRNTPSLHFGYAGFNPLSIFIITIVVIYIGGRYLIGKKDPFKHFEWVLVFTCIAVLAYVYLFPTTQIGEAINQYYKERSESRTHFWNTILG